MDPVIEAEADALLNYQNQIPRRRQGWGPGGRWLASRGNFLKKNLIDLIKQEGRFPKSLLTRR